MNVTVEKLENSMAKLTIEVSAEDFDKAIDDVYKRQRNKKVYLLFPAINLDAET